ncbi:surface protein [Ruminococcus flavefaciens]|uniref:Surface protein n=1 Tax=Ruminococcus flavefaciens TaxID=1265 RepID=A0A1H6INP0_RUMFL|nr:BspA family leucine-rich repeat surface protein [Ruminococcus flavefaciens]SEH48633.1 surface protein [Ruminococcus flavefaciens]
MKFNKLLAGFTACICMIGSISNTFTKNTLILVGSADDSSNTTKVWSGNYDTSWYDNTKTEFQINTAEQLAGLVNLNISGDTFKNKTFYLQNNFSFSNYSLNSMDTFEGIINGMNHSISGLKNPFIKKNSGTIEKISFNSNITSQDSSKTPLIGIIANESNGNMFNCNVSGYITCNTPASQNGMSYPYDNIYIGGICGKQTGGMLLNCSSSVNITRSTDRHFSAMYVGGICGYSSSATIRECTYTNGSINATATPLQSKTVVYTSNVETIDSVNKKIYYECYLRYDNVDSKLYVGGICGNAQIVNFYSCKNSGTIICKNKIKEGATPSINYETGETISTYTNNYGNTYYNLKKCYRLNTANKGKPTVTVETNVGCICGSTSSSNFYGCSNSGTVTSNNSNSTQICGYKDQFTKIEEKDPLKITTTTTKITTTSTVTSKKTTTTSKPTTTTSKKTTTTSKPTTTTSKKTTTTSKSTTTTSKKTTTTSTTTITSKISTTSTLPPLELEENSISLTVGEQFAITANQSNLTYESSDKSIATVSKSGVITARTIGSAMIFVSNSDDDTVILRVTVSKGKNNVEFDEGTGILTLKGAITVDDIKPYRNNNKVKKVVTEKTTIFPENSKGLFSSLSAETFELENADTSQVTDMSDMFLYCTKVKTLDLRSFDTSNVTKMAEMFDNCNNLSSVYLSSFNTSKVTNMCSMFINCPMISSINISNFDTSNVTNMKQMFFGCDKLINLDLSKFDTSNVNNMNSMFAQCYSLTSLDLKNFNTSRVTDMGSMFANCNHLTSLNINSFDTSNVINMETMFYNCSNLTSLDLTSFNISSLINADRMFNFCSDLKKIIVSNKWKITSKIVNTVLFNGCNSLIGGNGTKYNPEIINTQYACVDEKGSPGYFTASADYVSTIMFFGDANCDDEVDLSDAVLIMQSIANPNKYGYGGTSPSAITQKGMLQADVDISTKGLTGNDALKIQKYLLKIINTLDPNQ